MMILIVFELYRKLLKGYLIHPSTNQIITVLFDDMSTK